MNNLITESTGNPRSTPNRRRSLATIERRIKRLLGGRQNTRRRVQIANLFAEAHQLLGRKRDAEETDRAYQAWCRENFRMSSNEAQMLRQIGENLVPSQVRIVSLDDQSLYIISQAPRE